MFYILSKKIGCVPYFFQLIVSEERDARMFTSNKRSVLTLEAPSTCKENPAAGKVVSYARNCLYI